MALRKRKAHEDKETFHKKLSQEIVTKKIKKPKIRTPTAKPAQTVTSNSPVVFRYKKRKLTLVELNKFSPQLINCLVDRLVYTCMNCCAFFPDTEELDEHSTLHLSKLGTYCCVCDWLVAPEEMNDHNQNLHEGVKEETTSDDIPYDVQEIRTEFTASTSTSLPPSPSNFKLNVLKNLQIKSAPYNKPESLSAEHLLEKSRPHVLGKHMPFIVTKLTPQDVKSFSVSIASKFVVGEAIYKCKFCPAFFFSEAKFMTSGHSKLHADRDTTCCSSCGWFIKKADQQQHQKVWHVEAEVKLKSYQCDLCPLKFETLIQVIKHSKFCQKSGNPPPQVVNLEPTSKPPPITIGVPSPPLPNEVVPPPAVNQHQLIVFKCTKCIGFCLSLEFLEYHMQLHHQSTGQRCAACGWLLCPQEMLLHKSRCPKNPSPVWKELYDNNLIEYRFKTSVDFGTDPSDDRDMPYYCDHCGYMCTSKVAINLHVTMYHSGENLLTCDRCGNFETETFCSQQMLQLHSRDKHNQPLPLISPLPDGKTMDCCHCSETCPTKKLLDLHKTREHPMEVLWVQEKQMILDLERERLKPLKEVRPVEKNPLVLCDLCENFTGTPYLLAQHQIQVHFNELGLPAIVCELCGYETGSQKFLRKHKRISHPKLARGPFPCKFCGQKYSTKQGLKQHMESLLHKYQKEGDPQHFHYATADAAYVCNYCGKKLHNTTKSVINHLNKVHQDKIKD